MVQEGDQTKSFDDSTLQGVKYWAFYFSTSWCPDCKAFTPKLVSFYKEFKPENPNFELILVCEDKTEEPMLNYLKTEGMPWPALRFSDIWNRTQHAMKYAARGIPNLVLVDENGKVLSSTYKGTEHLGSEEQILQSGKVMDDIKKLVPKPAL